MRPTILLPLAALVLLLVLGWLWLTPQRPVVPEDVPSPPEAQPEPPPPATPAPTLAGTGMAAPPPSPTPPGQGGPPISGRGAIRVTLVPPEGTPPPESLRLQLETDGVSLVEEPLARRQDDGTYLFESVPAMRYRVRAFVPGFQDVAQPVSVPSGGEVAVSLDLLPGAEVVWSATLYSGEAPESVRLALFDGRGVRLPMSIHLPGTVFRTATKQEPSLPATGRIGGLKPGHYRLRGTSPAGETDEQEFDARAGETVRVEVKMRK